MGNYGGRTLFLGVMVQRDVSPGVGVGDTAMHTEVFWASAGCSRKRQTLGVTRVGVSHFLNDSPHQVSVPAA